VAACHQHVRAADESRRDQAVGGEIGLPDGVVVEHIAHENHVANHQHSAGDQTGGDVAAELREQPHAANVRLHPRALPDRTGAAAAAPASSAAGYFTESASSISFLPFGTSLANSTYELFSATLSHRSYSCGVSVTTS